MRHFIFLIPKTPTRLQDKTRKDLWELCVKALLSQTCQNWKALVIGENACNGINDGRFLHIDFEGKKEAKLQKATDFIIENNISGDYVLRLDDDDIINPNILERLPSNDFDLFVDQNQWFWHYETGKVSTRIWPWFPNTCIHKREHALNVWGNYAEGDFPKFKPKALLIENDHSKIHPYYFDKKVVFSKKRAPIYLRTITSSSITALNSQNGQQAYLKTFGNWKNNTLNDFHFLKREKLESAEKSSLLPELSLKERLINYRINFSSGKIYRKMIQGKNHI